MLRSVVNNDVLHGPAKQEVRIHQSDYSPIVNIVN